MLIKIKWCNTESLYGQQLIHIDILLHENMFDDVFMDVIQIDGMWRILGIFKHNDHDKLCYLYFEI